MSQGLEPASQDPEPGACQGPYLGVWMATTEQPGSPEGIQFPGMPATALHILSCL